MLTEDELDDKINRLTKDIKEKEKEIAKYKDDMVDIDKKIEHQKDVLLEFDLKEKELIESKLSKLVNIAIQTDEDEDLNI